MSWNDPVPPVMDYGTGLLVLTLTLLATAGLLYLLLG